MNENTQINLEPRVARLETGMETLIRNVSEMTVSIRDSSTATNVKIDAMSIAIAQAAAPKKPEWSLFVSIGFFILALGSAVFWPLNKGVEDNKNMINSYQAIAIEHIKLDAHPVAAQIVKRLEEQLATHIVFNDKTLKDHIDHNTMEYVDLDKKLQLEYNLMNAKIETQISALDAKLQLEIKLLNLASDAKLDVITKNLLKRNDMDMEELRAWRAKANGLVIYGPTVPASPMWESPTK